jgi:hypothetical protein
MLPGVGVQRPHGRLLAPFRIARLGVGLQRHPEPGVTHAGMRVIFCRDLGLAATVEIVDRADVDSRETVWIKRRISSGGSVRDGSTDAMRSLSSTASGSASTAQAAFGSSGGTSTFTAGFSSTGGFGVRIGARGRLEADPRRRDETLWSGQNLDVTTTASSGDAADGESDRKREELRKPQRAA